METRTRRVRGPNWNHEHTKALAELKREASLNNEDGGLVWERTAQTLSSRFPGLVRTGAQCRRRWDTLVKVYNHIEDYCVQTGAQGHRELDEGELASMELATAYHQDWYDIVEQVCSQRKRIPERCASDLMLAKGSKGPEHPPTRDTLYSASTSESVTHREQSTPKSTLTYAQVLSSASLEVDKLSPGEEVLRLKNRSDGLGPEARQHGQVSHEISQEPQTLESANQVPYTLPAENGAQLKEPLQDDVWALLDDPSLITSAEIEQLGIEIRWTDHASLCWQLRERSCHSFEPIYEWGISMASRIRKALRESNVSRATKALRESKASGALIPVEGKRPSEVEVSHSAGSAPLTDHDILNSLSKLKLNDP